MQSQNTTNYQDSLFCKYFSDENRLKELAGALHDKIYTKEDPLEIVTLKGTFLSKLKNDISFVLANKHLVFLEHQSTDNQNMPLRCLYYVAEQFRKNIDNRLIYAHKKIKLAAPEFHVFYTGDKKLPSYYQMRLSDAYLVDKKENDLELIVHVHTMHKDKENKLFKKSLALKHYYLFIWKVKENIKLKHIEVAKAVQEAVAYAIKHDVMKDFLRQHEYEVINMVDFEWNEELFKEVMREEGREEGIEEGRKEGRKEGRQEGRKEGRQEVYLDVTLSMLKERFPIDKIARIAKLPVEEIQKIGRMHNLL